MKETLIILIFTALSVGANAQTFISITSDTTLSETITVEENTVIDGNMHTVIFSHDGPKFNVQNGSVLLVKDMRIPDKKNWGSVDVKSCGVLEWRNVGMVGHISTNNDTCNPNIDLTYWLDGVPK